MSGKGGKKKTCFKLFPWWMGIWTLLKLGALCPNHSQLTLAKL